MKALKFLLLPALLFCSYNTVLAQFEGYVYEEDSSIKISRGGVQKKLAWCGGINNPQYAVADLNKDGLTDLVVYQRDRNSSVKTFINYGTPAAPNYRYRPQYVKNFPNCSYYLILKDYNGDGIADLFESGGRGFSAHKGYYNADNELCFTYYKTLYYNNSGTGLVNASVNPQDIPAIVDVDNDGDLDFLAYYGDGVAMNWYQNMQVELGKPKDTLTIRLADQCWGKTNQKTSRNKNLGVYCDNSMLSRTTTEDGSTSKTTDGGNTPCLIDMDGDGDYDVLDGHVAFNYLVYLENGKAAFGGRDSMVYQDIAWNTLGDTAKIAQWPAAFHVDIDGDGIRDLMVAPNASGSSENYKCSRYYRNIGTDKIPSFKFQTDTFITSDAIDVGSNSYPFLYDYNRDGKPDLFVGSGGYYEAGSGQYISRIMYLQNTSSSGNPSFEIITDDFLGLSAKRYKGISIAIGDINNDGKDDLVMGHLDGSLHFINNVASSATSIPNWTSTPDTLKDATGTNIVVDNFAAPLVYDISADGLQDLIIGEKSGFLVYYENKSTTPGSSSFIFTNDQLGFAKSDPGKIGSGYSAPYIGRIDNTPREYLMMGSGTGRIFRYTDFQGGAIFSSFRKLDSTYSYILSQYAGQSLYYSAPAIGDVDGDGNYEMIVGNIYGGLLSFKQVKSVNIPDEKEVNAVLSIFPNPAKNEIHVGLNQTFLEKNTSITIYNQLGQAVKTQNSSNAQGYITLDIASLPNAVYYCVLRSGTKRYSSIFMKQN